MISLLFSFFMYRNEYVVIKTSLHIRLQQTVQLVFINVEMVHNFNQINFLTVSAYLSFVFAIGKKVILLDYPFYSSNRKNKTNYYIILSDSTYILP